MSLILHKNFMKRRSKNIQGDQKHKTVLQHKNFFKKIAKILKVGTVLANINISYILVTYYKDIN